MDERTLTALPTRGEIAEFVRNEVERLTAENRALRAYSVGHVLEFLDERAAWFDREMRNGGNLNYLSMKRAECAYIAKCIRDTRDRLARAKP